MFREYWVQGLVSINNTMIYVSGGRVSRGER